MVLVEGWRERERERVHQEMVSNCTLKNTLRERVVRGHESKEPAPHNYVCKGQSVWDEVMMT